MSQFQAGILYGMPVLGCGCYFTTIGGKKVNHLLTKLKQLLIPAAAGLLLFASVASAHVTVSPGESPAGAWETYTVKVPVEKESATVQVDLRVPAGAEFMEYEPVPGWEVTIEGNKVSWIATGKGIQPGQFQRFTFTVKNPAEEGEMAWDAYQHYADGSLVQWSGGEDSDTPHSVTELTEAAADAHGGHSHGASGENHEHAADSGTAEENNGSVSLLDMLTLVFSGAALLLTLLALFRTRKRR